MQKTLGGDRLGSGKKMKVELHNYERSTHDLGYLWRSTMAAGTLVPFMSEVALPGDTFDINLGCDIKTHPTIGPLFGSYKVQLDVFQAPIRLYNSKLHNNALGIGRNMSTVKLPQIRMTSIKFLLVDGMDLDNSQINPSSILAYLGLRGVGIKQDGAFGDTATRDFNAIPLLAYWDIYKNYYANKQEEIGVVLHTPTVALVQTVDQITMDGNAFPQAPSFGSVNAIPGKILRIEFTGATPIPTQILIKLNNGETKTAAELATGGFTANGGGIDGVYDYLELHLQNWQYQSNITPNTGKPTLQTFNLSVIDDMRESILAADGTVPLIVNVVNTNLYAWPAAVNNGIPNSLSSQEGLGLKTYQSDLFNNWLKTENIEDITTSTAIDTTGGSFTIDQLNLSRKVYNMLNRINVSGGSYDDWLDAVYTHDRYQRCETPMYMGGLIKELIFQEVISNSESNSGQPLGTLAGKGVLAKKHKGGTITIKVDEPSYILGIISLTPRIDYSQGNKWDVNLKTMDDFHKPALDEIGFQELITEQMAWWHTNTADDGLTWEQKSAGKQPAWLNYMTNVNQTRGNFAIASNEMFMTLNRRYENTTHPEPEIEDLTTYIDPSKYNFIFAETQLDAQNFWAQIAVDITARRKMSAKIMPNL